MTDNTKRPDTRTVTVNGQRSEFRPGSVGYVLLEILEATQTERDEARKVIAGGPRVTEENYRALLGCRARIAAPEEAAAPIAAAVVSNYNRRRDAERRADALTRENETIRAERDSLSALHEVATERTVQVAAVIEQAKRRILDAELDGTGRQDDTWNNALRFVSDVLERVDTDAALREVRAAAFDEGWIARAERDVIHPKKGALAPHPSLNPYREEADR